MSENQFTRARVLHEALPHIQKYNGKTVVVKYGGNAMVSEELRNAVISDVVLLNLVGVHVVLVHGGGPEISQWLKNIGHESRFVDGLRYTDETTMEVVQMCLCGKINKDLCAMISHAGGRALGLCGLDGAMIQAEQLGAQYGLVGNVTRVDPAPICDALDKGYIPVVATVAAGVDGHDSYNINADTAAAKIATALEAERLIILSDIPGLMRDVHDPASLIPSLSVSQVPALIKEGIISGGMIPKIDCCVEAVRNGVRSAVMLDGRVEHSILVELLTNSGMGTMLY